MLTQTTRVRHRANLHHSLQLIFCLNSLCCFLCQQCVHHAHLLMERTLLCAHSLIISSLRKQDLKPSSDECTFAISASSPSALQLISLVHDPRGESALLEPDVDEIAETGSRGRNGETCCSEKICQITSEHGRLKDFT